jgi:ssDNA-binding Zn-finger/Zn-ribbon topoisomerase 1
VVRKPFTLLRGEQNPGAENEGKLNELRNNLPAKGATMSDMIRVQCPKCGGTMKEKAKKIRGGFAMPCTHCATSIVFESESNNSAIRQALSQARRIRRQAMAVH